MQDLFVSLDYSKFLEAKRSIENKLEELVACRHDYPMWPIHGDNPVDVYEQDYHSVIRHQYYRSTLYIIQVVRMLRKLS